MDGPMNKNAIQGRRGRTTWHNIAKSNGSVVEILTGKQDMLHIGMDFAF